MKHRLVVIGQTGSMRAYLDVPLEEAKRRYIETENETPDAFTRMRWPLAVNEFEFKDEFWVYEASSLDALD